MRYGVTMFATDLSIDVVELARRSRSGPRLAVAARAHHIPTSRRTPHPSGGAARKYKRSLDPLVALAAAASATTTLRLGTGILLPAGAGYIVTAKAVASLDHVSGAAGRPRRRVRLERGRDGRPRRRLPAPPGDRASTCWRCRRCGATRSPSSRRARVVPARVVVAQTRPGATARGARRCPCSWAGLRARAVRPRRRVRRRLDAHRWRRPDRRPRPAGRARPGGPRPRALRGGALRVGARPRQARPLPRHRGDRDRVRPALGARDTVLPVLDRCARLVAERQDGRPAG